MQIVVRMRHLTSYFDLTVASNTQTIKMIFEKDMRYFKGHFYLSACLRPGSDIKIAFVLQISNQGSYTNMIFF